MAQSEGLSLLVTAVHVLITIRSVPVLLVVFADLRRHDRTSSQSSARIRELMGAMEMHEIRTPLTVVQGVLEVFASPRGMNMPSEQLQEMATSALQRTKEITHQLTKYETAV